MKLVVIVLLVSTLAVVNNIDLSRPDNFSDSQALSINWFKYWKNWKKRSVIPTPAPVMTPKHEPVIMPEYRSTNIPKYKPAATPKLMISPQATNTPMAQPAPNLNQQFDSLRDEVMSAKQRGSLFSPDHSNRILTDLSSLESKGYPKIEIEKLRQIVYEFTPDLKKQSSSPTSPISTSTAQSCLKTNPTLVADITDFSKIQKITAPGTDSSEGPKGHSFIWTGGLKVPIYAPIDIILDSGSYVKDNANAPAQYILWFLVKGYCDFQVKFDHIDEPIEPIRQNFPSTPKIADSRGTQVANKVELKAGELLGYTKGNIPSGNWDFGMYDMSKEGPLAQYGSQGSHRNAVCWPDFYTSEKRERYRRLLDGPRILCSFSPLSGSQSQPQPTQSSTTSSNSPPVIKNLGINFDTAFVFLQSEDKLFREYGAEVTGPSGPKILPTFEYRTAKDADVFAISDGVVKQITYQNETSDYEIHVLPSENSQWTIEHDHVNNPKISIGNQIKAGDIIGKVGNLGGSLGRTEIMMWDSSSSRPMTYCPLKYFDPQLVEQYKQKITKHMRDWEEFKSNPGLYNEDRHVLPGCVYEKLAD